jgi:RNA polymerase sigma-70 factor (ECF subfamily)
MPTDATAADAFDLSPEDLAHHLEAELVERHRRGDPSAFLDLYRSHAARTFTLALRMAGNEEEAADWTQEIFLRVHRHLGRFRGDSTLKTWLYRVALNHCRTRLSQRPPPSTPIEEASELADQGRNPEEVAVADESRGRVEQALAGLDPVFREAVVLRDLEELSYDEIAALLGVPIGTVRSRIARGRSQLRAILNPGANP